MSISNWVDFYMANAESKKLGDKGRSLKHEMTDKLANCKLDLSFALLYYPDRVAEIHERIGAIEYILDTYCRNQLD